LPDTNDNKGVPVVLEAVSRISTHYVSNSLPQPHTGKAIKAIFLGADPGTVNSQRFTYVFKLEDGESSKYFRQFVPSLRAISLTADNLFVQNLCRNYFDCDTLSHKKDWLQCAVQWMPILKEELDELNPNQHLPVLVSAYVILEALCKSPCKEPQFYYANRVLIRKNQNLLGRTLIPFFRGGMGKYDLGKPEWSLYSRKIAKYLKQDFT
jgi:hypothetical protein